MKKNPVGTTFFFVHRSDSLNEIVLEALHSM